MRDHPAKGSFPVSVYGDEAKYSTQYGDKFIAVALGSPLLWKKGILTYIYIYILYIYIYTSISTEFRTGTKYDELFFNCSINIYVIVVFFTSPWILWRDHYVISQSGTTQENFLFFVVCSAIAVGPMGIDTWMIQAHCFISHHQSPYPHASQSQWGIPSSSFLNGPVAVAAYLINTVHDKVACF